MLKLVKSYLLLLKSKTDRLLHYFRSQEFILDLVYDDGCKGIRTMGAKVIHTISVKPLLETNTHPRATPYQYYLPFEPVY